LPGEKQTAGTSGFATGDGNLACGPLIRHRRRPGFTQSQKFSALSTLADSWRLTRRVRAVRAPRRRALAVPIPELPCVDFTMSSRADDGHFKQTSKEIQVER
jgi:hypothetical protein